MGENAPEEKFLPLSTIFCYLMLGYYVKTGKGFSLRDKRFFEITEVEITRVDCISFLWLFCAYFVYIKFICIKKSHNVEKSNKDIILYQQEQFINHVACKI